MRYKKAGRYDRDYLLKKHNDRAKRIKQADRVFRLGPNVARGSKLHNVLKGKPMIVVGNAHSLNELDLDLIRKFPTLGCNRILRLFEPDYYTVVDRHPYRQDVELIKKYKGTRILSETLFDPAVSCHRQPVQPLPDYEWYRYRAVASTTPFPAHSPEWVFTYYSNDRRVKRGKLPSVQTNLDLHMPSGANIAYCMLQIAIAMGANPIGICGVDMMWESEDKSHFFGRGKDVGAFKFNDKRVMIFMRAAAHWGKTNNVKIYNLSPKGILTPTFPRITDREFHRLFGGDRAGNLLRRGKLIEFKPDPALQLSTTGQHGRSESDIKEHERKVAADRRSPRLKAGSAKNSAKQHRATALERSRARRKALARRGRKKG